MDLPKIVIVMLPEQEWIAIRTLQQEILQQLKELYGKGSPGVPINYITAKEFMEAVRIKRTKFDQLVQGNKIKVIKKQRKIYVPVKEVERYFSDSKIQ